MSSQDDWIEGRSPKKARFEEGADSPAPPSDTYDDTEDLYNDDVAAASNAVVTEHPGQMASEQLPSTLASPTSRPSSTGLPGLDLLQDVPSINQPAITDTSTIESHTSISPQIEQTDEKDETQPGRSEAQLGRTDGKPRGDTMNTDTPVMAEDSSEVAISANAEVKNQAMDTNDGGEGEFLEAAQSNKNDAAAEWQYDSSDMDTDSSDDSDDSSEASEDVDYELLDPAEQARILMAEEGGSDDEGRPGGKPATHVQPRTTNELPEVYVEKPNVTITAEMDIVELGTVVQIVDNLLVVQGTTSAETQVLEHGSVLCLADRSVIGAVAEPLGRVSRPMYSVAFTSADEMKSMGLELGVKVFYSKEHAVYAFTKPLMLLKGSDASNIHDEEIGDHEIEFSDDEAEAEYKRKKKQERLDKRGGAEPDDRRGRERDDNRRSDFRPQPRQVEYPDKPISYDDDGDNDGLYTPLSRPDPQAGGDRLAPPPYARPDRGRGQGRGRGPAGRGRGRGNQHRERPQRDQQWSNSNSFPPQQQSQYSAPLLGLPNAPQFSSPLPPPPGQGGYWNGFPTQPLPPPSSIPPGAFINPAFFAQHQPQLPPPPPFPNHGFPPIQHPTHYPNPYLPNGYGQGPPQPPGSSR